MLIQINENYRRDLNESRGIYLSRSIGRSCCSLAFLGLCVTKRLDNL